MRKGLGYEIFMTALVLVIIAGVAGALLGLVNHYTEVDEDELIARKASAVYYGALERYVAGEGVDAPMKEDFGEVLGVYVPKGGEEKNVYVIVARGFGAYKGSLDLLVKYADVALQPSKLCEVFSGGHGLLLVHSCTAVRAVMGSVTTYHLSTP